MALSEDQAALLRLLLAGDTYEQVADVLGTSLDEVRRRAHEAAAALEREPVDDYPPQTVRARLAALDGVPEATPASPTATAAVGDAARRRVLMLAGITAAVVVVAVLVVLVASGGDGESSSAPPPDREDVVPVRMSPVGGSQAGGTIAIVRAGDQPAVDLALRGLDPSGPGETYVLWFVGSGGRSLPVAFQAVGRDGRLTGRTPVPTAASGLLPSFDTADLTLTRQREAAAAVQRAAQSGTLPQPVGITVLRGALR
jgi:hypothetical protein